MKKKELIKTQKTHHWLEQFFLPLTGTIEKHILISIHRHFNQLFQEWFDLLIDNEQLNARIDDAFTPIIEQNGYEIFFEHLSGGERTSAALAYRLALNRVINEVIQEIKTKDLLILDEPTEDLDLILRRDINNLLKKINKEKNVTMIITSHLLSEMEDVCSKVAILNNHKILASGTVDELKNSLSKSIEIILKTENKNYEYAMKQINAYNEVKGVKVWNERLYVYSQNPLFTLQNLIRLIDVKKERIVEINVNRPTLNEVFEELINREMEVKKEYGKGKAVIKKQ